MNYQARREAVLEKMEKGSVAILYSGIEVHVSADESFMQIGISFI